MTVQLSPALQKALPLAVEAIAALLARFGEEPTQRTPPVAAEPWWTRAVA
jgi:hypothetical protein